MANTIAEIDDLIGSSYRTTTSNNNSHFVAEVVAEEEAAAEVVAERRLRSSRHELNSSEWRETIELQKQTSAEPNNWRMSRLCIRNNMVSLR
jgi:hypothetical protein